MRSTTDDRLEKRDMVCVLGWGARGVGGGLTAGRLLLDGQLAWAGGRSRASLERGAGPRFGTAKVTSESRRVREEPRGVWAAEEVGLRTTRVVSGRTRAGET